MIYTPGMARFIEDNAESIRLIEEQGVMALMTPRPGCNSSFHPYGTEHHWCLASYHCGHSDPKDNGYAVLMMPKTEYTKEQAMDFFYDIIKSTTEGGIYITLLPIKET